VADGIAAPAMAALAVGIAIIVIFSMFLSLYIPDVTAIMKAIRNLKEVKIYRFCNLLLRFVVP
jgi:hypothetical protein